MPHGGIGEVSLSTFDPFDVTVFRRWTYTGDILDGGEYRICYVGDNTAFGATDWLFVFDMDLPTGTVAGATFELYLSASLDGVRYANDCNPLLYIASMAAARVNKASLPQFVCKGPFTVFSARYIAVSREQSRFSFRMSDAVRFPPPFFAIVMYTNYPSSNPLGPSSNAFSVTAVPID